VITPNHLCINQQEILDMLQMTEILLLDYYDNIYKKSDVIDFSVENSDNFVTLLKLYKILEKQEDI